MLIIYITYFNVIVVVSILPVFIRVTETCTTCTLNDLVTYSIRIERYTTFIRNLNKKIL